MEGRKPERRTFRTDRAAVLAIDPADADESPIGVGEPPVSSSARHQMTDGSPVKGIATSEGSSSSESEDEECKLGMEENEGMSLVSKTIGAETGGLTGEPEVDESTASQMLREDRITIS